MRVGILTPSMSPDEGGAEAVARAWAAHLAARGHHVVAMVFADPRPFDSSQFAAVSFAGRTAASRWLALPGWVRATARQHDLDAVISVLDFSNITLLRAFLGRRDRPRLVISEHSVPDLLWARSGTAGRVKRVLGKSLYRHADAAVAVSHAVATNLRVVQRVPADRLSVIPNAIAHHPNPPERPSPSEHRVLFVGRLTDVKRPELMLETMLELRRRGIDWPGVVVGDGPLRAAMEQSCRQLQLPMQFVGWLEPWQQIVREGDCLLLTSDVEGLGNVLVEAAALGVPSVAPSSALGVADAMISGVTGKLASAPRARDLADALIEAASLQPDPRDISPWLANFTPTAAAQRLESLLSPSLAGGVASRVRATHVGPAAWSHGGMSSVLAAYRGMPFSRYEIRLLPSWARESPLWGLRPFLGALDELLTARPADLGVVHVHLSAGGSFVREGAAVAVARARRLPLLVSLHSSRFAQFATAHPRLVHAVLRRADRIVVLGASTTAVLPTSLHRRVAVIPNAIELPDPGDLTPAGESPPMALFAGNVTRRKGVDVLLQAWALVRDKWPAAALVIAGPPGDVPPGDVPPGSEPGVTWKGPVSRDEVQRLLRRCRLAVLPSRGEVMPMFVMEAMAASRPVVATRVGEVPAMLGDAGLIVDPGSVQQLADALITLLEDPALATRLGDRLRERAEREFSPSAVAAAMERLYDGVQGSRRTPQAIPGRVLARSPAAPADVRTGAESPSRLLTGRRR